MTQGLFITHEMESQDKRIALWDTVFSAVHIFANVAGHSGLPCVQKHPICMCIVVC